MTCWCCKLDNRHRRLNNLYNNCILFVSRLQIVKARQLGRLLVGCDDTGKLKRILSAPKRVPFDNVPRGICSAQLDPGRGECSDDANGSGEDEEFNPGKLAIHTLGIRQSNLHHHLALRRTLNRFFIHLAI